MSEPFQDAYLSALDAPNPYEPRTAYFELFELGHYYHQHAKAYEPIHRHGPGLYRGLRSGDVFRFSYDPLRIEAVPAQGRQEKRERSRSTNGWER
jgi:hypothetical protein